MAGEEARLRPGSEAPRRRLRLEVALAFASAVTLLLVVLRPDWIEAVFGIDPDQHDGSLEALVAAAALAIAIGCGVLARREWQRVPAPSVTGSGRVASAVGER
jgi:hypothetical protein